MTLKAPAPGPYSTSQMRNFYADLAAGQARPSGVMNYVQHLYVAERCAPGDRVLDACCGRCLLVPILANLSARIACYVGVDICEENIGQARDLLDATDPPFEVRLLRDDVTQLTALDGELFDVAAYTSAIEHMGRDAGARSLVAVASVLRPGGRLYLSTPHTPPTVGGGVQYGVHVYEWHDADLRAAISEAGLHVEAAVGLLPQEEAAVLAALARRFGEAAASWYRVLRDTVPAAFLDAVAAAATPEAAKEVLYVCRR